MKEITKKYLDQLDLAISRGAEFGLNRKSFIGSGRVSDGVMKKAIEVLESDRQKIMHGLPDDISTYCVTLSARAFISLNLFGIPADMVIGAAYWQGQCVFPCAAEDLKLEMLNPGDESSPIRMHAWVSLGGDAIIDLTLPHFLAINYDAPKGFFGGIIANRVKEIKLAGIEYEPIVVGSEYIGKVNPPDPILELTERRARRQRLVDFGFI